MPRRLSSHIAGGTGPRAIVVLVVIVVAGFALVLGVTVAAGHLLAQVERPDGSTGFDHSITSWMVDHRTSPLTFIARAFSAVGSQKVLTPVVVIVAVALAGHRRLGLLAVLVVTWGGAILLYSLAKLFVGRPRPPIDIRLTRVAGTSFPSGHAVQSLSTFLALAAVAAVAVAGVRWPVRALAVGLGLGVGWSRVYLGVHWTTDVFAGWLMALAWTVIIIGLAGRIGSGSLGRRLGEPASGGGDALSGGKDRRRPGVG
jgi:undecaprenyl-diphosphatase